MEKTEHKLDLRALSETRKNKVTGKSETVVLHPVRTLTGNGRELHYHPEWNEYFLKDKGAPLSGEPLEAALKDVRWEFSKVEKNIDLFPPTPENIALKRKELFADLGSKGSQVEPADIAKIYNRTSPSHIAPSGKFKSLSDQLSSGEEYAIRQLLRS